MGVAYEVQVPELTVPKALSEQRNTATGDMTYDHTARTYRIGDTIAEEDVSPVIRKLYEDGDPHTLAVLKKVESKEGTTPVEEMTPEQRERFEAAAEAGALGPYPLEYGVTGPHAAPGVIDPAAAAEQTRVEQAAGVPLGSTSGDPEAAREAQVKASPDTTKAAPEPTKAKAATKSEAKADKGETKAPAAEKVTAKKDS